MNHSVCRTFIGLLAITLFLFGCSNSSPQSTTSALPDPLETQRAAQEQAKAQRLDEQRAEEERQHQQLLAFQIAITNLLKNDASIGDSSNNNYTWQASSMRKLDLSACPRDFAAAYITHIHAWEDAAEIQRAQNRLKSDGKLGDLIATTLLQKLLGSEDNALKDAEEIERKLNEAQGNASIKIKETFNEVERIAVAYGAALP